MIRSVWIGFDPREGTEYGVCRQSIRSRVSQRMIPVRAVNLDVLRRASIYTRPHTRKNGQLWDDISDAPMATEFACSRFLVPELVRRQSRVPAEWALFMDCDMLVRDDIHKLFAACDPNKAVMVVKHDHNPAEEVKMDGQIQTRYSRKNWSSVCAFNIRHPANLKLTPELVNSVPGRDLHAFCWLTDDQIGEFNPRWNYLVGHSAPCPDPAIVHFTDGSPRMQGYEGCEYADEWRHELDRWLS